MSSDPLKLKEARREQYRATSEALKREKMLFLTRSPPYDGERGFTEFVGRVEALLGSENTAWSDQMRQRSATPPGGGG